MLSVKGIPIGGHPIDFDLQPGGILAVLGDNGSGKSLLLSCLTGHLRTAPGVVRLGDEDLSALRAEVGVVSQHPGLIRSMTVFENVALPFLARGLDLDGGLQEQVELRLNLVGCGHLADEAVHHLSEGDKRRVALARALSGRTRLLVADEPVAALAPAKKALVRELLITLVQTGVLCSIVLATQDIDFARRTATHVLLLRVGGHTFLRCEDAAVDEHCRAFAAQST
ncbi:ATP-binding cassette domain-containing protein [Chthoniobacter flavus]|uniref:ATP-binding cassette domain-containing protein n=1 Tax=Chthoniobacter flavus TaxID=191863 RepID=UPI00030CAD7C|nr:ATP-binding cassette domain-containing protein [Chthoniobacter flavus]